MKAWESKAAWVHHALGVGFYFYEWLSVAGVAVAGFFALKSAYILALGVGGSLVFTSVAYWILASRRRCAHLNPSLDVLECVDTYTVLGNGSFIFKKELTVRSRAAGVSQYSSKFKWTGGGRLEVQTSPNITYNLTASTDVWDVIRAQFSRPLRKDEKQSFWLQFSLAATDFSPQSYTAKLIDDFYPHGLTMKVVLRARPHRVFRRIFATARADIPSYEKTLSTSEDMCEFSWNIKRPRFGRRYHLAWEE